MCPCYGRSAVRRPLSPTIADVARLCSRTGCSERAGVTLTYDYARAHVWLDDLVPERDPHAYDLCGRHAGALTVPQGWQLRDRRDVHAAEPRVSLIAV